MKAFASALVAGVLFAFGLGIAGMTNPAKVIGFLDVGGQWDPSLAYVMAGAIAVHAGAAQWALRVPRPLWANAFVRPSSAPIDAGLVGGAALFGLGWGIAGYCPGPALVDLAAPSTSGLTFAAAMIVGMVSFRLKPRELREPNRVSAHELVDQNMKARSPSAVDGGESRTSSR